MIESGSFRDPTARVFYESDRVLRGLSTPAAEIDRSARDSGLMGGLTGAGLLVDNWLVTDVAVPAGVPDAAIVESERVPVISYPSEWSFGMLKAAALLTLDANLMALEHGFILKDASAFNIAFHGTKPSILDVTSIEPFGEKGIWTAYSQFCDHFLSPLLLEAYAGVAFQGSLRTATEGIAITDLSKMLRGRAGLHKGVLSHVRMRSALERRAARMDTASRSDVGRTQLPKAAVVASVRKMRKLVSRLESRAASTWAAYESALPYSGEGVAAKEAFVRKAAAAVEDRALALDVGANAGRFTAILTAHFDHVVAIDNDAGAIDAMLRAAADQGLEAVTPMVVDVTNPTPAFGWRGRERKAFTERVQPTFASWLAVLHHLCLGIGIPLDEAVAMVYDLSGEAVVEFVEPDDPMAKHISASRRDDLAPYSKDVFEGHAERLGEIVHSETVSATRTLYHLRRR